MSYDIKGRIVPDRDLSAFEVSEQAQIILELVRDARGCRHDAEQEQIEQAEREAHEAGECKKGCWYCEEKE